MEKIDGSNPLIQKSLYSRCVYIYIFFFFSPGYARRKHRDPCRRVVSIVVSLRVDKIYDRKVAWDRQLSEYTSEPYQQLSYESIRAVSFFSIKFRH